MMNEEFFRRLSGSGGCEADRHSLAVVAGRSWRRCSASATRCAVGTVTYGCQSRRGCAAAGTTAAATASWRLLVRQG
jgi:hypothetical protein